MANQELIEFHEFEQGEERHNDLSLGGCGLEKVVETFGFPRSELLQQEVDFVRDGETIVDDIAEVVAFLKALENILKGADEVED